MVVVAARALGRKRPLLEDWSIDLPPPADAGDEGGGLTLRQLIERVVRAEVSAFRQRHREATLLRVLSAAEVASGAEAGRVIPGGRPRGPDVDADEAVGVALGAFTDGMYLVILDGHEQRDLEAQVFVRPDSRLTFLRLALLAGG